MKKQLQWLQYFFYSSYALCAIMQAYRGWCREERMRKNEKEERDQHINQHNSMKEVHDNFFIYKFCTYEWMNGERKNIKFMYMYTLYIEWKNYWLCHARKWNDNLYEFLSSRLFFCAQFHSPHQDFSSFCLSRGH